MGRPAAKTNPDGTCQRCGEVHTRCRGHNKRGGPCGRPPLRGGFVCKLHGGGTTKAKDAAARRLAEQQVQNTLAGLRDVNVEISNPLTALRRIGGQITVWCDRLEKTIEERGGRISTEDRAGVVRLSPEAELLRAYMSDLARIATTLAKLPIEEQHAHAAELAASREWIETRDLILAALGPFPDAHLAVVAALRTKELDQQPDSPDDPDGPAEPAE